jgi:hypothetical protein
MTFRSMPSWLGFDFAFDRLIDRLDGLTDEEYSWQPFAGSSGVELTPRWSASRPHRISGARASVGDDDRMAHLPHRRRTARGAQLALARP